MPGEANGPVDLPGGYSVVEDLFHVKQQAVENFRSGAPAWNGASIIGVCSRAPNSSSGLGTTRTWCPRVPRRMASQLKRAAASPTSDAGTV